MPPPAHNGGPGRPAWGRAVEPFPRLKPTRSLLSSGIALLACVFAGALAYRWSLDAQLAAQQRAASQRLAFAAQSLESLLQRNEALPALLALNSRTNLALQQPTPQNLQAANAYLASAVALAGVDTAYVMDTQGLTLAASNWNLPSSFVGQNYRFRPYFEAAMQGQIGRFFGVGVTTGRAGYFMASALPPEAPAPGVVAVKISLDAFEAALAEGGDTVLLADGEGVVFVSTEPAWRYRTLAPIPAPVRTRLQGVQQYGNYPLTPLQGHGPRPVDGDTLRLQQAGQQRDFSVAARTVGPLGWQMLLLADQRPARQEALVAGLAGGLCAALVLGLALLRRIDRQGRAERAASDQRLREAHGMLEAQIAQRTREITAANTALEERVQALQQAEQIVRGTRDTAVQAGKLAVLGQMAAGMSHELNQPLAALQTLSDNAMALHQRQRGEDVAENLRLISQLAERMGRIVRQLKSFARKEPPALHPCSVREALDHALLLLAPRCQAVDAQVTVAAFDERLCVLADATRLEQVLVNLLRNGLDAVQHQAVREVRFAAEVQAGGQVLLRVADTGRGMDPEVQTHLFEPFYTTKAGEGLGLGLAISRIIVEGMGGTLVAANLPQGGAEFTVGLPGVPGPVAIYANQDIA